MRPCRGANGARLCPPCSRAAWCARSTARGNITFGDGLGERMVMGGGAFFKSFPALPPLQQPLARTHFLSAGLFHYEKQRPTLSPVRLRSWLGLLARASAQRHFPSSTTKQPCLTFREWRHAEPCNSPATSRCSRATLPVLRACLLRHQLHSQGIQLTGIEMAPIRAYLGPARYEVRAPSPLATGGQVPELSSLPFVLSDRRFGHAVARGRSWRGQYGHPMCWVHHLRPHAPGDSKTKAHRKAELQLAN